MMETKTKGSARRRARRNERRQKRIRTAWWIAAAICFLAFALLTWAVTHVDVQNAGPNGSPIGLASLNLWAFERAGVNAFWDKATDGLAALSLLLVAGFGAMGLFQLVRRRSLWRVDVNLLLLGVFYGVMAAVYLLFECVVVNCRPVLVEGVLEASYPSSHTMLTLCVMGSALWQAHRYLGAKRGLLCALDLAGALLMALAVAGRLLSGMHWLTDVAAGTLLAAGLVALYAAATLTALGRLDR